MTSVLVEPSAEAPGGAPKPLTEGRQPAGIMVALWVFVTVPFLALLAAVPLGWGGWLTWPDAAIGLFFYVFTGLGVTVGYHRYLTHGSFKARRWLRILLAAAGSMAVQGSPTQWVADHRRHHAYSDVEGDPHSPWRYGASIRGLTKGLLHAHVGWLFHRELSNRARFAPDLVADKDIQRVDAMFIPLVAGSLVLPALAGWAVTGTWQGALGALFWAGLVRVSLLHHVTWSINSICHVVGERPFQVRQGDRATNFWPLALISFGESWHNMHHSDPTSARHGVRRGQLDISARTIWALQRLGWVYDVRWPRPERIAARLVGAAGTPAPGAPPPVAPPAGPAQPARTGEPGTMAG